MTTAFLNTFFTEHLWTSAAEWCNFIRCIDVFSVSKSVNSDNDTSGNKESAVYCLLTYNLCGICHSA